ncbi:hypothetical protein R8871_06418 [Paraburkholderia graminis C4D1M]|uniref:Phosphopantetheine-binding n=1 Tax=Paraburkholderia graminis (strain ATCC 700544 / DSM 17151 / LMG 18924 / NCIMB 13744 / C4D1M) TaxID=396598 RepID=B1G610_PARG4|nr:acyl carrier protein [Paraburkholderia graminis]EDT08364.1 phosphopantetheine-binding [Paraburkholderia graminis C4D1M]CAB3738532.1 hypothetical protein R8871_06418 [Paraburkholderia graminis C4D1M]
MSNPLEAISMNGVNVTKETILSWIQEWSEANNLKIPPDLDQTFAEAGFDSMHSVELAFHLEDKLKIKIDETVLYDYPTFASLAEYLVSQVKPDDGPDPQLGAVSGNAAGGAGSW